jgi:hypothetical protein
LADNAQALKMVKWMVDYFYNRVRNVITNYSVERHYLSLNEETGGMNDVLYKLFSITVSTLICAVSFASPDSSLHESYELSPWSWNGYIFEFTLFLGR